MHDLKVVTIFERHARKLIEQYGQAIEPSKADLFVAGLTDGVRVAGFKTSTLQGAEMIAYAG